MFYLQTVAFSDGDAFQNFDLTLTRYLSDTVKLGVYEPSLFELSFLTGIDTGLLTWSPLFPCAPLT